MDLKELFTGSKKLVGLDIGSSSLKLAEIVGTSQGPILNRFRQIPVPPGVIVDGVVEDAGALSSIIKELFRNSGCKGKGIVTSLSGNSVIVKKVTLAQMEEVELRELIHDEAGKYLPFDNMDDVNYDFQILGDNEYNPNQMDVIIVAAKKTDVNSYLDAISAAGLTVMIMDVDSFALETMYEARGVGLAATQVNVHKRVIVMDISEEKNQPICLINPEIVEKDGEKEGEEGCLSVPGFFEPVKRAEHIKVTALNREGKRFVLEAGDLLAVCIQHEMDHLLGHLFVDYLSAFKRNRIKTKLEKIHKSQGR